MGIHHTTHEMSKTSTLNRMLRTELERLQSENAGLKNDDAPADSDISDHLQCINASYNKLRDELLELKSECQAVHTQNRNSISAFDSVTMELRNSRGQIESIREDLGGKDSMIYKLKQQVSEAAAKATTQQEDLDALKMIIESKNGDIQTMATSLRVIEQKYQQEVMLKANGMEQLQAEMGEMRSSQMLLKSELEDATSEKRRLSQIGDNRLADIQRVQNEVQTYKKKQEKIESNEALRNMDRVQVHKALDELQGSLLEKEDKLQKLRSDKAVLLAEVQSGRKIHNVLKSQLEQFQSEIATQQRDITALQEQNKQLKTEKMDWSELQSKRKQKGKGGKGKGMSKADESANRRSSILTLKHEIKRIRELNG